VLVMLCACAEPAPSRELVVVAHQDDDMLFMQPHLFERVRDRSPTTIVYVTAGDDGQGIARAEARARAARFAYGTAADSQAWTCGAIAIAGHAAMRCTLEGDAEGAIDLVFLGYPDGGVVGEHPQSLLHLWDGSIDRAITIAEPPASYARDELVDAVAAIIDDRQPSIIHTLEIAATHGDDHSDHMFVGALVELAAARSRSPAPLVAHRGYNVSYDPPNLDEATFAESSLLMRAYLACMSSCGTCETPCETIEDPRYVSFLHRSYSVATRSAARGRLDGIDVVLDARGLLHAGGECLEAAGALVTTSACTQDPAHHFRLDAEGHLWSGLPPPPAADMQYDHESCVVSEDGRLHVARCGASRDARWQLE
jgi:LmbE family N-acetylglucosaminyl deacetylase